jgi:hypothetical protein
MSRYDGSARISYQISPTSGTAARDEIIETAAANRSRVRGVIHNAQVFGGIVRTIDAVVDIGAHDERLDPCKKPGGTYRCQKST